MKLVSDRGSTDLRVSFEHEGLESGSGQIKGSDQAVVATADDDDIFFVSHMNSVRKLLVTPSRTKPLDRGER
jgi:hypothetical protein